MMPTGPAATGLTVLELLQADRFTQIPEMFAPSLRSLVSAESVRAAWTAEVERHGPVTTVGPPVSDPAGPAGVLVRIPVTFAQGEVAVLVGVSDTGWVTGIQIAAADAARAAEPWRPPGYADPGALHELDVTVGDGPLAVDGTLALPGAPGPHPAVVLLAGSGPQDRDETMGRNKPFKDLAWGLAARGIATLRFDKVTYAHRDRISSIAGFTVDDEYLHHAVAALRLLREQPAVDPARVFLLGHSLGGTVAPRVAAADPAVAGMIILAGGAQPLHWAAVRQVRYLASLAPERLDPERLDPERLDPERLDPERLDPERLDPERSAAAQPIIDTLTRQAQTVDSPDLSADTPAADLPFGAPAAYWLSLRGYDPAAAAAALGKPMLILQGGRDYQATVADDLARWQDALAGHPDVTVRVYDADNHLFFPGSGPSKPAEYEPAQHVDPAVVADIATWLTAGLSGTTTR